jgi:hyperosmotically inducible periplasmic protein
MPRRLLLLLAGLIVVVAGCATVDPREDTRIEAEIKARLVAEKNANLTRLGVVSTNGTVYLSGTVESSDQRARAETLATGVRGVRRVVNTLEVQSSPR